jgi:hypothetical protein
MSTTKIDDAVTSIDKYFESPFVTPFETTEGFCLELKPLNDVNRFSNIIEKTVSNPNTSNTLIDSKPNIYQKHLSMSSALTKSDNFTESISQTDISKL